MAVSNKIAGNAVGVLGMVVWATNFPLSAEILKTWHPLSLTPVRLAIAGLIVMLAALAVGQGRALLGLCADRRVVWSGMALGASSLFLVWGQKHTDAVTAAIIASSMPLLSVFFGWFAGRERFTPMLVLALLLAVGGGVTISLADLREGGESTLLGMVSLFVATALYVLYSRLLVDGLPDTPVLAKTAASTLIAALLTVGIVWMAAFAGLFDPVIDLSERTLGMIVALGLAVGLSAVLWFWVGGRIGVTVASVHSNLVPFYVILMAAVIGSNVMGLQVLGALMVVMGAAIAQWPPAPASRKESEAS
jgi:drug/metabolite transporter (DMT)-like permease